MSITVGNETSITSANETSSFPNYESPSLSILVPILVFLAIAIFIASFGNLFTAGVYLWFPSLRTPFNFYIFNLAIADLFVGVWVMPCFAIYNFYGYWPFGEPMCSIWVFCDWFMTFESVLCLAIISGERLWSITWPVSYMQKNTLGFTKLVIIGSWLYTCCVFMPPFFYDRLNNSNIVEECGWDPAKNLIGGSVLGILGYLFPFTIMIVCYVVVGWKMRTRFSKVTPQRMKGPDGRTMTNDGVSVLNSNGITTLENDLAIDTAGDSAKARKINKAIAAKRDRSALITLGAILLAFCACWLPFYVYFFATLYKTITLPAEFLTATYWLAYLNSALNPLLNTILHRDFRIKFKEMVKCRRRQN